MMDGYAVRAGEGGSRVVVDESAAGAPSARVLGVDEAAPISTGALLPAGSDAIVPIEVVRVHAHRVEVPDVTTGAFVRAPGSDLRAGEALLAIGARLDPAAIALLAGEGRARVRVARRPRVAIVSMGRELVPLGVALAPGQLHDSNGPALVAACRALGADATLLPVVSDDLGALTETLASIDADLIVTSGGASVGPHDHLRDAIVRAGGEVLLWRVAMKPGKPLVLARLKAMPILGLPGNPVSALVSFLLFVRPVLQTMLGAQPDGARAIVTLSAPLSTKNDRPTYLRARVRCDGARLVADLAARQGSAALVSLHDANALVVVEPGEHALPAGASLPAWLYAPVTNC